MRKSTIRALGVALLAAALAVGQAMAADLPGEGVKVRPARATWNTGYFQAALINRGLTELGYKVERPKELQNPIFYQTVALGDVDFWPNGWYPNHISQHPKGFDEKATQVGYLIRSGGLQGYLVSKDMVEKFNIKSLDDFKRDEVKKAFDANGDGKADLVACPPGWGCEKVITHHFKAYGLDDYINPIKASYSASMAETLARHKNGKPIFFYTWAPNWTIFKLKPGKDVMWINVPKIDASEGQKGAEERMTVAGVQGAVTDPVKLGFVVSDIRVVANKKFLADNPAAAKFLEIAKLPLEDINEQNTKMQDGENKAKDIERHVDQWIVKNKATWEGWLAEAKKAAI